MRTVMPRLASALVTTGKLNDCGPYTPALIAVLLSVARDPL